MATYAVGDIQGCYDPLVRLLDKVNFDQSRDTLICVGDLVNRGPDSLSVLRLLKSLNNQCVTVLGNHDIHLLAMIYGIRAPRPNDTLDAVLNAPDISEIAFWLRQKQLMYVDRQRKTAVCHAGIYPWWSLKEAQSYSQEVSDVFKQEKRCIKLLKKIYSNSPKRWDNDLKGFVRLRFIINAFTRMRLCSPKGNLNMAESGFTGKRRKNRIPWFEIDNPRLEGYRIVFGHWSALGLLNTPSMLCLDTGCVWDRHMTLAKIPKKPRAKKIKQSNLIITPNF
jgi:bis(5'-nucleosyl)-tetraphosphatase (symmetrical)